MPQPRLIPGTSMLYVSAEDRAAKEAASAEKYKETKARFAGNNPLSKIANFKRNFAENPLTADEESNRQNEVAKRDTQNARTRELMLEYLGDEESPSRRTRTSAYQRAQATVREERRSAGGNTAMSSSSSSSSSATPSTPTTNRTSSVGRTITSADGQPYTEAARAAPTNSGQLQRKTAEDMMRVSPQAYDWMNRNQPEGKRIGVAPTQAERDADTKLRAPTTPVMGRGTSVDADSHVANVQQFTRDETAFNAQEDRFHAGKQQEKADRAARNEAMRIEGARYDDMNSPTGGRGWDSGRGWNANMSEGQLRQQLAMMNGTPGGGGDDMSDRIWDPNLDGNPMAEELRAGQMEFNTNHGVDTTDERWNGTYRPGGRPSRPEGWSAPGQPATTVMNVGSTSPASAPASGSPVTAVNRESSQSNRGAGPERSTAVTDSLKSPGSKQTGSVNKRRRFKRSSGEDPLAQGGLLG